MPRKLVERLCPACLEMKTFRPDCKTCGCVGGGVAVTQALNGTATPVPAETDDVGDKKRTCTLHKTRIHTLEDLIEHFAVDMSIWRVKRFVANKWEMGYIERKTTTPPPKGEVGTTVTNYEAGHEELYQVKAEFERQVNKTAEFTLKENAKLRTALETTRRALTHERQISKHLSANGAGFEDLLANCHEFVNAMSGLQSPEPITLIQPPTVSEHTQALVKQAVGPNHTEDAVLLLSDTHFGDRSTKADTSGFPEFDLTIAGNRFGYCIEKARQCLTMHRAMYPIKTLHVWHGGDLGNGELHDSVHYNVISVGSQIFFTYMMFKMAIEELLTLVDTGVVEKLNLMFTIGNHMRMDPLKPMPMKLQNQRNYDHMIYQFLIETFKRDPRITIKTEISPYIFENIRGHRYGFVHGYQVGYKNRPEDQCKSFSAFQSKIRALFDSPEYRKLSGLEGTTFARMCMGDIHVPVSFPRILTNGSLPGQNELGVAWGLEPIPAGMQLFGVTESHIETFKYFLDCSAIQRQDLNRYAKYAIEYEATNGR